MAKPIVRKITGTVQGFNSGEEVPKLANNRPAIGDWTVRFKAVISNKFNSKAFAADHPILYKSIWLLRRP